MSHLHTQPGQHDLTVSAYIVRTDFDQPKIMLHRHKKLHVLLQFGGHVELDENPWQALSHELLEESGYELAQLQLLQPTDRLKTLPRTTLHPQPAYINTHPIDTGELNGAHYHIDIGYAFVAEAAPKQLPQDGESTDVVLLNLEEILKLDETQIWPDTVEICRFVLETCLLSWEQIPAAGN